MDDFLPILNWLLDLVILLVSYVFYVLCLNTLQFEFKKIQFTISHVVLLKVLSVLFTYCKVYMYIVYNVECCVLYCLHCTINFFVQFTVYSVLCTFYSVNCSVYSALFIVYSAPSCLQFTLLMCSVLFTLYI